MTTRKPPGMTWESWIDRQIREAQERGDFDGLRGAGKPLSGLDRPRDPDWWHKQLMRREGVEALPTTLLVRKELDAALAAVAVARSEEEVREIVEKINARILDVNRKASSGPPSTLMPLDPDRVLRTWRDGRAGD